LHYIFEEILGICVIVMIFAATLLFASLAGGETPTRLIVGAILAAFLLVLSSVDILELRLPNVFTLPLAATGILTAALPDIALPWWRVVSALIGYGSLAGLAYAYRYLSGREGLGLGDAKLFAASGAWVGAEGLPLVLLCASLSALVSTSVASLMGSEISRGTRIPFGPFLALGTWFVWLYGPA
jgi:leader peptidase (prepilin peptidase) / N-methyltransferase